MRIHITISPDNPELNNPYGIVFDVSTDTPLVFCKDLAKEIAELVRSHHVTDGMDAKSIHVIL